MVKKFLAWLYTERRRATWAEMDEAGVYQDSVIHQRRPGWFLWTFLPGYAAQLEAKYEDAVQFADEPVYAYKNENNIFGEITVIQGDDGSEATDVEEFSTQVGGEPHE